MRGTLLLAVGLGLALAALPAAAAPRAVRAPEAKGPPACAAISFRPLPAGMPDGEQQAGLYRSRFSRLVLNAEVKGGQPIDYYVTARGKRLAAAPGRLPGAVDSCATAKRLPRPAQPASSCTGNRFRVLIAHAGRERVAALYAEDNNAWRFCRAGSF
jgi:hypothetical protein